MSDLSIANTAIRNQNNLYNLNDLHKASGNKVGHKPANWLQLKQTQELIAELTNDGIPSLKQNQQVIEVIHGGQNRGTFVCKELVYAYATWISPRFFLQVLRTFDAVISAQPQMTETELAHWQWSAQYYADKIGHDQTEQMRFLMRRWIERSQLSQQTAYNQFHAHMNISRTDQITKRDFQKAMDYLHLKSGGIQAQTPAIKPSWPQLQTACLDESEQHALSTLLAQFRALNTLIINLQYPLQHLEHPHAGEIHDRRQVVSNMCYHLQRFA